MIILLAIAAAVIGVLFWADRRFPRTRHYHAGPVIISDWARAAPDNDYGDVYLNTQDDHDYSSDDYQDNAGSSADYRKSSGDQDG